MKFKYFSQHYLLHIDGNENVLFGSCGDHMTKKDEFLLSAVIASRGKTIPDEFVAKSEEILKSYGVGTACTDLLNDECKN